MLESGVKTIFEVSVVKIFNIEQYVSLIIQITNNIMSPARNFLVHVPVGIIIVKCFCG